ncbi:MAG: glutamyl-tRNA reductase [Xanthomonadales bacterium]|nr:glutamyl-tRNA reductase [Xanthomonadales bacterium]MCB1634777.1 glutamyl-tRNA reductase [Xanthomonadales bacterium]
MALLAVGLNHVTAPLALRERAAFPPEHAAVALQDLCAAGAIEAAALVSTCNRTELYLSGDRDSPTLLQEWWLRQRALERRQLDSALYRHVDADAVRHLFRVATGLDSMVLGEPQILGQLKDAHRLAREAQTLSPALDRLFQRSFAVAKQVRSETALGENPVSVAYAAVRLLQRVFDQLPRRRVVLLGAGETIELAGRHLQSRGVQDMLVVNRTLERASQLAARLGASAAELSGLESMLVDADVLFVATHASTPLVTLAMVQRAFRQRRHRPLFVADLSVPRNVDPAVGELSDVYLYALDDLAQVVEEGQDRRRDAALLAETLVSDQVGEFMSWWRAQGSVDAVRRLRRHGELLQQQQLQRALAQLAQGAPADAVLQQLAHGLTNKLLHGPTRLLREAAEQGDQELLGLLQRLYPGHDKDDLA